MIWSLPERNTSSLLIYCKMECDSFNVAREGAVNNSNVSVRN